MDLESAAASLLRQWRGNSGIVEAFAEHDFRLKRLIGMVCIMELVRLLLALLPAQRKVWQPSLC